MQGVRIDGRAGRRAEQQTLEVELGLAEAGQSRRRAHASREVDVVEIVGFQFGKPMRHTTVSQSRGHATVRVVHVVYWQPSQAGVAAVGGRRSRNRGVGSGQHLHRNSVDMAYGIGSWPHRRVRGGGRRGTIGSSNAVLPHPTGAWRSTSGTLTAIAWARRRGGCLVELLLVAQQEISPSKASRTLWAFERLLLRVRPLVAFQML